MQRFTSVDPLAHQFPGYSPYNYTMNNPINMIDPDGRAPVGVDGIENTIYYDKNGNELGRTEDNLDNAIVVVDDIDAFNKINGGSLTGDQKASALRETGTNYMVDGMTSLYEAGKGYPNLETVFDENGNRRNDLNAEVGSFLEQNGNTVCVSSGCIISDHAAEVVTENTWQANSQSESIVGRIHTHPNAGERIRYSPNGRTGTYPFFRSGGDFNSAFKRGQTDAVIDSRNIYLYGSGIGSTISAPRSFFK